MIIASRDLDHGCERAAGRGHGLPGPGMSALPVSSMTGPPRPLLSRDDFWSLHRSFHLDQYFASLARKRMAAGALFRDEDGRVLLVDPTYKPTWELPGGVVEKEESPHAACRREVAEELGLDRRPGRALVVDWVPSRSERPEGVIVVYDGGVLAPGEVAAITLPDGELAGQAPALDEGMSAGQLREVRFAVMHLDGQQQEGVGCWVAATEESAAVRGADQDPQQVAAQITATRLLAGGKALGHHRSSLLLSQACGQHPGEAGLPDTADPLNRHQRSAATGIVRAHAQRSRKVRNAYYRPPQELLAAATRLMQRPDAASAGIWPRAAALLARQALELAMEAMWTATPQAAGLSGCSMRSQILCLAAYLDPDAATRAAYLTAALSHACHYHPLRASPHRCRTYRLA